MGILYGFLWDGNIKSAAIGEARNFQARAIYPELHAVHQGAMVRFLAGTDLASRNEPGFLHPWILPGISLHDECWHFW